MRSLPPARLCAIDHRVSRCRSTDGSGLWLENEFGEKWCDLPHHTGNPPERRLIINPAAVAQASQHRGYIAAIAVEPEIVRGRSARLDG